MRRKHILQRVVSAWYFPSPSTIQTEVYTLRQVKEPLKEPVLECQYQRACSEEAISTILQTQNEALLASFING